MKKINWNALAAMAVGWVAAVGGWVDLNAQVTSDGFNSVHATHGINGWNQVSGTWVVDNGYLTPNDGAGSRFLIINNYDCSDDGTFTVTLNRASNWLDGGGVGVVFRYNSPSQFYYIGLHVGDPGWGNTELRIGFSKNPATISNTYDTTLNLPSRPPVDPNYTIKIKLTGSLFEIFDINDNKLGQFEDDDIKSGRVGYAYGNRYDKTGRFVSSSWKDADPPALGGNYLTWDKEAAKGFTAGGGAWTDTSWTKNGTTLRAWGADSSAHFRGTDGVNGAYAITVTGTQAIDTLRFDANGYSISGGTLNRGTRSGNIFIAPGKTASISSVLAGSKGLTIENGGNFTLGGNNTYTGPTKITGNVTVLHNNALGIAAATTDTVTLSNSGTSLNLSGGRTINKRLAINSGTALVSASGTANTWSGNITLAGTADTIRTASQLTIGGVISGTGNLIKTGTSTLVLTGANTYTGTTAVNAGNLQIGNNGTTGTIASSVSVAAGSNIIFNRSNAVTHNSVISGAGGLTKQGAGTLTLAGTNTYTGATTVSAGTLVAQRASATAMTVPAVSATTVSAGATRRDTTSSAVTYGGNIVLSGNTSVLEFNSAGTATNMEYTGNIGTTANTGRINKTGTGTLTLSGQNRADSLVITAGRVNLNYGGTARLNANVVAVNSGAVLGGTAAKITLPSAGSVAVGGTLETNVETDISGGSVNLYRGSAGTIVNRGGKISSLGMSNGSVMKFNSSFPRLSGTSITLDGTLDAVIDESEFPFGEVDIAVYTTVTGMFDTVRVNGDVATIYNSSGNPIKQNYIGEYVFNVEVGSGMVKLVLTKTNLAIARPYLAVTSARYISLTEVELVVSGIDSIKSEGINYTDPTKIPYIDSVGIWYSPTARILDTSASLLMKIAVADLLSKGVANLSDYPAAGGFGNFPFPSNTRVIKVTVPLHSGTPPAGAYTPDVFYYFNIKEYWVTETGSSGKLPSEYPNMKTMGDSTFMRPPEQVMDSNKLAVKGEEYMEGAAEKYEIEFVISNYTGLPDSSSSFKPYKPYVDSVGVWIYKGGSGVSSNPPGDFGSTELMEKYSLLTMKNSGVAGEYKRMIDVTDLVAPNPADIQEGQKDTLYIAAAPRWTMAKFEGNGPFDKIAPAAADYKAHICTVIVMTDRSAERPNNPFVLTYSQPDLRYDSVWVSVKDPKDPENPLNAQAYRVVVQFAWNSGMSSLFHTESVVIGTGDFDTAFNLPKLDQFAQERRDVYWEIIVYDTSGAVRSPSGPNTRGSFTVGRPRPAALRGFTASAQSHNRVRLSWNKIAIPGPNSSLAPSGAYVLIRQSDSGITLPADSLLARSGFNIILKASNADSVAGASNANVTRVNDTTVDITGLKDTTRYWFAGAVMDSVVSASGKWNLVSKAAVRDTVTLVNEISALKNILKIDGVYYDESELSFEVTYSLAEPNLDSLRYFGCFASVDSAAWVAPNRADTIKTEFGKQPGTFKWFLGTDILFDTTWYISLRTYKEDETGAGAYSAGKVIWSEKVDGFYKQPVVVGVSSLDAGYANNRRFRVQAYNWPSTVDPAYKADIQKDFAGEDIFTGDDFIYVSLGYSFTNKAVADSGGNGMQLQQRLTFSVKAETIPAGYTINDVRLYKYDSAGCGGGGGCWDVVYDGELNKPEAGWVTAQNLEAASPAVYRLMIDKQKPKLFFRDAARDSGFVRLDAFDYADIEEAGSGFIGLIDTFSISKSNVNNFTCTLYYSRADSSFPTNKAAINLLGFSEGSRKSVFTIAKDSIRTILRNTNLSLRAFLVISDGRHADTVNVSRSVKYKTYTNHHPTSVPGHWVPVVAQAALEKDKRAVKTAMAPLFGGGYDNTVFRIFRYNENKWDEYSENNNIFTLEQGRLFWIKTAKVERLEFDAEAQSPSLIDPYEVTIAPKQWMDLMLPFPFDIYLGDVFDATDKNTTDQLQIYRWNEQPDKTYRAGKVFLGGIDNLPSLADSIQRVMLRGGVNPFTVYNSGSTPVTLKVPPVLAAMSKYRKAPSASKAAAKLQKGGSEAWFYTVNARVGSSVVAELIAGCNSTDRKYDVPPSFGGESVVLIGADGKEMGHFLASDFSGGGRAFRLRFTNSQNQRSTFSFSAQASMFAPPNTQVVFVNAETGEPVSGKSEYSISVGAQSHEDVYMVVGSKDYLAKTGAGTDMKFVMGNIAVNQAARSARIRYYVPFAGIERVEATAFDLKGNVVWKNAQKTRAASWNTMEWSGRNSGRRGAAAAGLYIVRVRALNAKGKTVAVADRRMTFVP